MATTPTLDDTALDDRSPDVAEDQTAPDTSFSAIRDLRSEAAKRDPSAAAKVPAGYKPISKDDALSALRVKPKAPPAGYEPISPEDAKRKEPGFFTKGLLPGVSEDEARKVAGFVTGSDPRRAAEEHPYITGAIKGVGEFISGMTSPENLAIMGGLSFLGPIGEGIGLSEVAISTASRVLSGVFAAQAASGAYTGIKAAHEAHQRGDNEGAAEAVTDAILNLGMGAFAGHHAVKGGYGFVKGALEKRVGKAAPVEAGSPGEPPADTTVPKPPAPPPMEPVPETPPDVMAAAEAAAPEQDQQLRIPFDEQVAQHPDVAASVHADMAELGVPEEDWGEVADEVQAKGEDAFSKGDAKEALNAASEEIALRKGKPAAPEAKTGELAAAEPAKPKRKRKTVAREVAEKKKAEKAQAPAVTPAAEPAAATPEKQLTQPEPAVTSPATPAPAAPVAQAPPPKPKWNWKRQAYEVTAPKGHLGADGKKTFVATAKEHETAEAAKQAAEEWASGVRPEGAAAAKPAPPAPQAAPAAEPGPKGVSFGYSKKRGAYVVVDDGRLISAHDSEQAAREAAGRRMAAKAAKPTSEPAAEPAPTPAPTPKPAEAKPAAPSARAGESFDPSPNLKSKRFRYDEAVRKQTEILGENPKGTPASRAQAGVVTKAWSALSGQYAHEYPEDTKMQGLAGWMNGPKDGKITLPVMEEAAGPAAEEPTPEPTAAPVAAKPTSEAEDSAEASHAAARGRTVEQNGRAAKGEAKHYESEHHKVPVLELNEDAAVLLDRLAGRGDTDPDPSQHEWANATVFSEHRANTLVSALLDLAEHEKPKGRAALQALAKQLQDHRTANGNVIVYRGELGQSHRLMLEELFHDFQYKHNLVTEKNAETIDREMRRTGESKKVWAQVVSHLVGNLKYKFGHAVIEAPAWIAAGTHDATFGIKDPKVAAKLLADYLTVARKLVPGAFDLPPIHGDIEGLVHDAIQGRDIGNIAPRATGGGAGRVDTPQPTGTERAGELEPKTPAGGAGAASVTPAAPAAGAGGLTIFSDGVTDIEFDHRPDGTVHQTTVRDGKTIATNTLTPEQAIKLIPDLSKKGFTKVADEAAVAAPVASPEAPAAPPEAPAPPAKAKPVRKAKAPAVAPPEAPAVTPEAAAPPAALEAPPPAPVPTPEAPTATEPLKPFVHVYPDGSRGEPQPMKQSDADFANKSGENWVPLEGAEKPAEKPPDTELKVKRIGTLNYQVPGTNVRMAHVDGAWRVFDGDKEVRKTDGDMGAAKKLASEYLAQKAPPELLSRKPSEDVPVWALKSESVIADKMKGPMNGPDALRMLRNNGVKPEELEWTGLDDYLSSAGRVTPQDVRKFISENGVKLEEITKGGLENWTQEDSERLDDLEQRQRDLTDEEEEERGRLIDRENAASGPGRSPDITKFSSYQLPGGANYREMLLTLPDKGGPQIPKIRNFTVYTENGEAIAQGVGEPSERTRESLARHPDWRIEYGEQNDPKAVREDKVNFRSSHWDEPNVLVHLRMNDRVTPDGKRLLHVEEIQSDWHQKGRKEGYAGQTPTRGFKAVRTPDGDERGFAPAWEIQYDDGAKETVYAPDEEHALRIARAGETKTVKGVPDAPFKKSWHEMAMRRMIRYAAENGYDGVSWTGGEDQAARYDLSQHIETLEYHPSTKRLTAYDHRGQEVIDKEGVEQRDLPDYIGKDAADELAREIHDWESEYDEDEREDAPPAYLSGQQLKVGGEGMKGFYDKIVPDYLNKFGKKFGARVEKIKIPASDKPDTFSLVSPSGVITSEFQTLEDAQRRMRVRNSSLEDDEPKWTVQGPEEKSVQYLPISPEMRDSVRGKPMELFSKKEPQQARERTQQGEDWLTQSAQSYMARRGSPLHEAPAGTRDARAMEIADAYAAMKHEPNSPAVKVAYDAMKADLDDQWNHAVESGIHFEPWTKDGQPYATSAEMTADVRDNHHLYFFLGGDMPADHPLAGVDPQTGYTYNDKLRAVHDLYGHAVHGWQFGERGEENAWITHSRMFSRAAAPALTSETKGQNNWVNFGPHMRRGDGTLIKKGEPGWKPATDRPFAEQKAGLLPKRFHYRTDAPVSFVSPNTIDIPSATEAEKQFKSDIHNRFVDQAHALADDMGLRVVTESALGSWEGGAENSLAIHYPFGTDPELVKYYEANLGRLGHQYAVARFVPDADGKDTIHHIWVDGKNADSNEIASLLLKNGIANSTIIPAEDGYGVTLIDGGDELADNIKKVKSELGVKNAGHNRGTAEFPGNYTDRDAAERGFLETIEEIESRRPSLRGRRGAFESRPDYDLLYRTIRDTQGPVAPETAPSGPADLNTLKAEAEAQKPPELLSKKPPAKKRPADLDALKAEADLRNKLRDVNLGSSDVGGKNSAALISGDNRVAVGNYHHEIASKVDPRYRGQVTGYWPKFSADGGVRLRGHKGRVYVEFGNDSPETLQRVRNVVNAVPGKAYTMEYRAPGILEHKSGDRDQILATLDDWERGGVRPSPQPGTSAAFREQYPPDLMSKKGSSVNLRSGDEKQQAKNQKRIGLDPEKTQGTREIAEALEARQRENVGTIARDDRSPESQKKIAKWMIEEIQHEMKNPEKSGVFWYSKKFQRALDRFAFEFPELRSDPSNPDARNQHRDLLTALIAITSDGQKVMPNFRMALDIYGNYRNTGRLETDIGHQRMSSINGNLKQITKLLKDKGMQGMHDYLLQEKTVKDLKEIAEKEGIDFSTSYQVDVKLPMAAVVFGPKLGAFYANLMGAEGYLTMDRWWSRSFNRYRGNLVQAPKKQAMRDYAAMTGNPEHTDEQVLEAVKGPRNTLKDRGFKTVLALIMGKSEPGKAAEKAEWMKGVHELDTREKLDAALERAAKEVEESGKTTKTVEDEDGEEVEVPVSNKEKEQIAADLRSRIGSATVESLLHEHRVERKANTIYKAAFEALEDAPFGATDRTFMLGTAKHARELLKKQGIDMSIADIQAVLWYYEKRLYGELGARQTADISYEEAAHRVVGERAERDRPEGRPVSGVRGTKAKAGAGRIPRPAAEVRPAPGEKLTPKEARAVVMKNLREQGLSELVTQ